MDAVAAAAVTATPFRIPPPTASIAAAIIATANTAVVDAVSMKTQLTSMSKLKKNFSPPRVFLRPNTIDPLTSSSVTRSDLSLPAPLKDWYVGRNTALLDQIHALFSDQTSDDARPLALSDSAADAAMSGLGIRLTERLVVDVVNHRDDVLSSLKFFHWAGMQKGFFHTHTTFLAIFKVMWRRRVGSTIPGFLEGYVCKRKAEHNMRLYDVLVMGYALAGRPDTALGFLGVLRFAGCTLDGSAYHVLLNSLADDTGRFDTFGVVLRQICASGLRNEVTEYLVVKRLCRLGRAEDAEAFLRRLCRSGRAVNGHMVGCLVDMLCREGRHDRAGALVNEFGKAGMVQAVHAYGAWVKSLVSSGRAEGALDLGQRRLDLERYIPNLFRYNNMICLLLRAGRLQEVFKLVVEMMEKGMGPDKVTTWAVLWAFCKAGMVEVASELGEALSGFRLFPNSIAFDHYVSILCRDWGVYRACSELKKSFGNGYFPERMAFSVLVDAASREGEVGRMREVIEVASERRIVPLDSLYNTFIASLCMSGKVEDAFGLFGELKVASKDTFASLISSFVAAERGGSAARLLIEMEDRGHAPSRRLFHSVVGCLLRMENARQCVFKLLELYVSKHGQVYRVYDAFIYATGRAGRPDIAREVFDVMRGEGVVPSSKSVSRMLFAYMRGGRISDALGFFDELPKTMSVRRRLYSSIIIGLCKAGDTEAATVKLEEAKGKGVTPCLECYESLVKSLCSKGRYDQVPTLVLQLYLAKRHITSFLGNTLLLHACDGLVTAWRRNPAPDGHVAACGKYVMLGNVISVFSERANVGSEIQAFEEAVGQCFQPNIYTYNLMMARLMVDETDQAAELFRVVCRRGYEPTNWTYDILAQGFFKKGRLAEARGLVKAMSRKGFEPSKQTTCFIWDARRS